MKLELQFGALCPPIAQQVKDQGCRFKPHSDVVKMQALADAIVKLKIHHVATDAEVRRMENRLGKMILKHVEVAR